jgi:hypothetical protein
MSFAPGLVGTFQDSEGGDGRHGSSPPSNGDGYRFGQGNAADNAAAAAIPRLRSRSSGLAFPQLRYAASNWKNDRLWGGQTSCASVGMLMTTPSSRPSRYSPQACAIVPSGEAHFSYRFLPLADQLITSGGCATAQSGRVARIRETARDRIAGILAVSG